jgi:hypothetical protein
VKQSDEESDNPLLEFLQGSNLDKARQLFAEAVKHRPRIRPDDPAADANIGSVAAAAI